MENEALLKILAFILQWATNIFYVFFMLAGLACTLGLAAKAAEFLINKLLLRNYRGWEVLIKYAKNRKVINEFVKSKVIDERYLLFIMAYYPNGGMEDLKGTFSSTEEAVAFAENWIDSTETYFSYEKCYGHIYDALQNRLTHIKERKKGWVDLRTAG